MSELLDAIEEADGDVRDLSFYAEDLAGYYCVLAVSLIEVPATEKQHRFRALRLEAEELLHHRSHRILFLRFRHLCIIDASVTAFLHEKQPFRLIIQS